MAGSNKDKIREAATAAYNEIDKNHNGKVSVNELERVLTVYYREAGQTVDQAKIRQECQAFVKEVDKNNDGKIQLNEFVDYFAKFGQK